MADIAPGGGNAALSTAVDDDQDFANPGAMGQDDGQNANTGPPSPQQQQEAIQGQQQAQTSPSAPSSPTAGPQVSGKAKFFGNLLKTLLANVQNAGGNPNNAFDRGFQNASPQAQQQRQNQQQMATAQISKAQSEADLMKQQVALTGIKALNAEYDLKRLPMEVQQQHLDAISKFKDNLIKEGADVVAEGDDEKASDSQAAQMNSTDPRSTGHAGKFYSLPTMDSSGKAKFDVVYVPSKDTLQQDYKYKDADGEEQTIPAGTPMAGAMGKFVENLQKGVQNDLKDQHKELGDLLKGAVPDGDINQTIGRLQDIQKENTPLAQQNKQAITDRIKSLQTAHTQNQGEKLALAKASAQQKEDVKDVKDTVYGYDPKTNELVMTNRSDAADRDLQGVYSVKAGDIKNDRAAIRQLNDVQLNVSRYKTAADAAAKNGISGTDYVNMHSLLNKAGALDLNVAVGEGGSIKIPVLTGLIEGLNREQQSEAYHAMSPEGKALYDGYIRSLSAVPAYQKALTGIGRSNKEMLDLELANIPSPTMKPQDIQSKMRQFQENLDRAGEGFPRMPGMKTNKDIRRETEEGLNTDSAQ